MRPDGPGPSVTSVLSSWLSLTGWMVALCAERASALAEGGSDRLGDAVADVGCPPADNPNLADELPQLDADVFVAALRDRLEQTLRQAATVINEEPNACMVAVTRDRVLMLFRSLAEEVLAQAMEQRIASGERERGEGDAPDWVRRYRRILAAEGRWPPPEQGQPTTTGDEAAQ